MIRSTGDILAYGVIGIMLFASCCIVAGYTILIRQALRSPERKRLMKLILQSSRGQEHELDSRGLNLIHLGAGIGAVVGCLLLVWLAFILRK